MKRLAIGITPLILMMAIEASGQTLPRFPAGSSVEVFLLESTFSEAERRRVEAAVQLWRRLLPEGITMLLAGETQGPKTCGGCITIVRESTSGIRRGECEINHFKGVTKDVLIRLDPRLGSGDKFQQGIAHELGHALGLDHRRNSIMAERPSRSGPSEEDAAILKTIYAPRYQAF